MANGLATALALALLMLAGCTNAPLETVAPEIPQPRLLKAGPALWEDPQNHPHPAFGWATLSHPPEGDLPDWWRPVAQAPLPSPVSGLEHVSQVSGIPSGAGIAVFGSVAVVPDFAGRVHFVDISDPTQPKVLSDVSSDGRGAAIVAYPDGRLVAAIATGSGFDLVDFTDAHEPIVLGDVKPPTGGHKVGMVPGTPILYNAASQGGGGAASLCRIDTEACTGTTEVYDLTDPEAPVLVQEFSNGLSCHHIFFWGDATRQRALCAGLEYTQVWDIADPLAPKVVVWLPAHAGVPGTPSASASILTFSHTAGLNRDGTVLYVGDESGGGGLPPGCLVGAPPGAPVGAGTPVGALWFYDMSDETQPRILGTYSALNDPRVNQPLRSCTAHHGRLVPEPGRDLLAMSFYGAGVILVDFTDIAQGGTARAVAQFADGSDTWETWYVGGYLVTGDLSRGMDILRLT